MRLFREPDAGNPPVRFDEREEETELSQTGLRRRGESPANRHREATVFAPLLDSTQNARRRDSECNRLWLLKNSSFLPNSQNLGDTKCLENQESRL